MSIYRRASGRYAVLIFIERTTNGKQKRRSLGTFATKKEAERAERDALTMLDRGVSISPEKITVGVLLDRYIADRRALNRGEKTLERYESLVKHNLAPHIGSIALAKLRPAHVSDLVATLSNRGGVDGRPLSAKTVNHAFSLLRAALAWAVRHEIVGRNVAEVVSTPAVRRGTATALSVQDAQRLVEAADGGRWGSFMRLALATGARRGELLALRWSDVDLKAGTLTIRASLSQTKSGFSEKGTKTDRQRTVALASLASEALKAQKAMQAREKLAAGSAFVDTGHVFQTELGGVIRPGRATEMFAKLAKRIGIEVTSLHSLRHTAVSWLIAAGVDVRTVSAIAGHASPTITLSIYSHLVAGSQAAAVARIDERFAVKATDRG